MVEFYEQWQVIFSFYDAMFLDMDYVEWVRPLLQSHRQVDWEQGGAAAELREVGKLMTDAP